MFDDKLTKTKQNEFDPPIYKLPLLGEPAAPFKAETTKGPVNFPFDYAGKWVVLFSHPGDFEPVCTTEFMKFQFRQQEFKDINTELLALSVDSIASHLEWIQSIYQLKWDGLQEISVNFPIIADPLMEISKKYGMVQRGESETDTVRALFIIDPNSKVRNIMYYSRQTGRNIDEIKRTVLALQRVYKKELATPANWMPGEDVIVFPPVTVRELLKRLQTPAEEEGYYCIAWYLCFTNDTEKIAKQNKINIKRKMPKPDIKKTNFNKYTKPNNLNKE